LQGYDYTSAGAYFVTICTWNRQFLFEDAEIAKIVEETWLETPDHFPLTSVDAYVVMPNHFHGIVFLERAVGAQHGACLRSLAGGRGHSVRHGRAE
jgi:REP element-mobilizing transposase RayT